MVQIQDLPIEVLSRCLSFIKWPGLPLNPFTIDTFIIPHQAMRNLMNISLVSRKFRDLAQPFLFRDLEDLSLDGTPSRFIRFLKAIIMRPQLRKYVHSVTLHPMESDSLEKFGENLPSHDIEFFTRALQEEALLSDMTVGFASLLLALLLTKTPNLRMLSLCGTAFSMRPLNPLFVRDPSFLSNLEELHLEGDQQNPDYNIATFHRLFTRPRLKLLACDSGQLEGNDIPTSWAPNTLAVEEIRLTNCDLNYNSLKRLIQTCKKLVHFIFLGWSIDNDPTDVWSSSLTLHFDEVDLIEALLPHQDTLEFLGIEFFDSHVPSRLESLEKFPGGKMPSLRDFPVLSELTIQFSLLTPRPEFPSALKRLTITNCTTSIWDMTHCIASDCKSGRYPELEQIIVLTVDITQLMELDKQNIPDGQTPEECLLSLRNLFKGTKVDYQIEPYPKREDLFPMRGFMNDGFSEDDFSEGESETEGSVDHDDREDQLN
ncbi:hypothetical protein COH20_001507 [Aspergillus flavus]|uniref:DNA, SC012 n=1 Tax=Aspergillus oryzae (strain ATCC 42149 / RIB 40) TaxID=510516 RepID=Q2UC80_ASPOR|nr:unnamed protein product [Aspergillus oryzae RIB40]RAQ71781.1 hypothetical protein COH21_007394 [Aspergillus flavus]RAQ75966.1 hypothetical protein COH20_001507 [Aspergillus flavus]BAE60835.1 unnamed protein product [Aspergillus oryzae RIB40]